MNSPLKLFFAAALLVEGQTLNPSSYIMENGQAGPAGLLYRDDIYKGTAGDVKLDRSPLAGGLGQLTDSTVGCGDDPRKDCGNGPGYEWVGWRDSDPMVEFDFGQRCDLNAIRVFTANWADSGARLWKTAIVSISDDGLNFRKFTVRTSTSEEQQNQKARYLEIPLHGSGRAIRIRFMRADANSWVLVSEVQFDGKISRDQSPPRTP